MTKPRIYRAVIDDMVRVCREGQGQIGAERARAGVWNQNATREFIPEQHAINVLLRKLDPAEREVLAKMLAHQVEVGVFEALKVLEEHGVPPSRMATRGAPVHDFVGRMAGDWDWPDDS